LVAVEVVESPKSGRARRCAVVRGGVGEAAVKPVVKVKFAVGGTLTGVITVTDLVTLALAAALSVTVSVMS
jgi:hypothetical protein